jgi:hypothetical protein
MSNLGTWTANTSFPPGLTIDSRAINSSAISGSNSIIGLYDGVSDYYIYYSTDGGSIYNQSTISQNISYPLGDLVMSGSYAIAGFNPTYKSGPGTIYYSTDSGVNWTASQSNNLFANLTYNSELYKFYALAISGENAISIFYAVDISRQYSDFFYIYYSTDGGNIWTPSSSNNFFQPSNTNEGLEFVSFNILFQYIS